MKVLNNNIIIVEKEWKKHSKASEKYVHVKFLYENSEWDGWVPVEYRRTGISISVENEAELNEYLNNVYKDMNPNNYDKWRREQFKFWKNEKPNAHITKEFFDVLVEGGWKCQGCDLPNNPNWARRIQDLKEYGYTLATNTSKYCPKCNDNKTHLILLPIKRGSLKGNGYETWSTKLRKKIIKTLNSIDVYEDQYNSACLPDHKFSEIRWDDNTKVSNPDSMSIDEIRDKFQLLSNQRNQQKREICRKCFQTGKRGIIFGIPYFYEGDENWPEDIPIKGKKAEKGCIGCPWYDIKRWRENLKKKLMDNKE